MHSLVGMFTLRFFVLCFWFALLGCFVEIHLPGHFVVLVMLLVSFCLI